MPATASLSAGAPLTADEHAKLIKLLKDARYKAHMKSQFGPDHERDTAAQTARTYAAIELKAANFPRS